MASINILSQVALYANYASAAGSLVNCSAGGPLSCHNTTAVANTCCFASPGGLLLQTQFWDTLSSGALVTGPADAWTVHGLWPDNCAGTYEQYCDSTRAYTNITQILQAYGATNLLSFMNEYWTDYQGNNEVFWEHEWAKHGTCISTFDTDCYRNYTGQQEVVDFFNSTVSLYKSLDSYQFLSDAGIIPSFNATYNLTAVLAALNKPRGVNAYVACSNGQLDEIWYYFNLRGSVQTGTFVPVAPVGSPYDCPATLKYLPKSANPSPTSTSTKATSTKTSTTITHVGPSSTISSTPFVGKGTMPVTPVNGNTNGCIIGAGTWYTTGTCAMYTGTQTSLGPQAVTLTSSKGNCTVLGGSFVCASTVAQPFIFTVINGLLAYNGITTFYTATTPTGSTQAKVEVTKDSVSFNIGWQSA